jgi:metal-responsive CopG/Arc/MetJ family transcriptional regulator
MASTSVHLPSALLERLDQLAQETGLSRNRLIVRACETYIEQARGEWPEDFFSDERIARADLMELHRSLHDWLLQIESARRNRAREPF